MPIKSGKFTWQERIFIDKMASTNDRIYAATAAGYAFPAQAAHALEKRPAVVSGIRAKRASRAAQFQDMADGVLEELLTDKTIGAPTRLNAVKTVDKRIESVLAEESAEVKELHELSGEELHEGAAQLLDELANRAKPVEPSVFD